MNAAEFSFPYKTVVKAEKFTAPSGGVKLQIERLENLNQTIDELFDALQKTGNEHLLEELSPYFGEIWPSARALTEYLLELGPWRGAKVLELGCGLALPSLLLAKMGAQVVATDFHPEVPKFLARNKALNGITDSLEFLQLDWAKNEKKLGNFNWVIASDVLYERSHPQWMVQAIARQLDPTTPVTIADPARPYLQAFSDEMVKQTGRKCETQVRRLDSKQDIFILTFR